MAPQTVNHDCLYQMEGARFLKTKTKKKTGQDQVCDE